MIASDARERVAVPNGVIAAVGAVVVLIVAIMVLEVAGGAVFVGVFGHKPRDSSGNPFQELLGIAAYGAMAWFALFFLRRNGHAAALRRPTRSDVRVFLIAAIVALAARIIDEYVLTALHQADHVQSGFEGFSLRMGSPWLTALAVALLFVSAALVGPTAEELTFRGLFFGGAASWWGVVPAAIASSLVFGALHGDPVFFAVIAVDGLIYALAYAASGNLVVSIALHAMLNGLTVWGAVTDLWS